MTNQSGEKTYNGWTNYETWNVKLWIDNEQLSYDYWRERARAALAEATADKHTTREQRAAFALRDALQEEIEGGNPLAEQASTYSDLLGAALSEVNWLEIAEDLLEEVADEG